jgi:hypothetical protein
MSSDVSLPILSLSVDASETAYLYGIAGGITSGNSYGLPRPINISSRGNITMEFAGLQIDDNYSLYFEFEEVIDE